MADTATTPKRMNNTHDNVQARRNNAGTSNSDTNTTDNHNSGDSGSDNENSGRLITNGVMIVVVMVPAAETEVATKQPL